VAGVYTGTLMFGPGPSASFMATLNGSYFLVSLDSSGAYRWGMSFDAIDGGTVAVSVAVSAQGTVFLAADLSAASVDVGKTTYNGSTGEDNTLLAAFDNMGNPQWVGVYGSATTNVEPLALGVDSHGDPIVAGAFTGTLTFGTSGVQPITSSQPDSSDMFLAKFDGMTGSPTWASSYGSAPGEPGGAHYPASLALNAGDDIVVTGEFTDSMQVGSLPLVSAGGTDIFLAEFDDMTGSPMWSKRYGSPNNDYGDAVAFDPGGALILVGELGATADLGNGNMAVPTNANNANFEAGFVVKYDDTQAFKWGMTFGGAQGVGIGQSRVAADANSNVILAGALLGSANFGGGTLMPSGINPNVYLAKLDASGAYEESKLLGDNRGQEFVAVTTDPTNNDVVIAFQNNGTVNLGTTSVTSNLMGCSLVIARFHP
jgi:hypothetical protein